MFGFGSFDLRSWMSVFVDLLKARVVDCFCTLRGLCLGVWIASFWRGLDFIF